MGKIILSVTDCGWRCLLVCFALICLCIPAYCASERTAMAVAKPEKHILVLNSYNRGLDWSDEEQRGVESVFGTREDVELYVEYMDTKRQFSAGYLSSLAELYRMKYGGIKLDIIISIDDNAFNFVRDHRDDLFRGVPVVFCGVNYFDKSLDTPDRYYTGVIEAINVSKTISSALGIHPLADTVVVVNDRTTTGKSNRKLVEEAMPEFTDKVKFRFMEDYSMPELKTELFKLDDKSLVLLLSFNRDRLGNVFSYRKSMEEISSSCPVPIYVVWDFYMGHGAVGGCITGGFMQGNSAAKMGLDVLNGRRISEIPVIGDRANQYVFDYEALVKAGGVLEDLPAGAKIINHPESFYSRHQPVIVGAVIFILVEGFIIAMLIANIVGRSKAERELQQANEYLERRVEERTADFLASRSKYQHLFDDALVGIFRTREDDGKALECNDLCARLFGFENRKEFILGFMAPAFYVNAAERDQMLEIIREKGIVRSFELQLRKKDGTVFWGSYSAKFYPEDGYLEGTIIDISERKALEEQLIRSERMAAVGTLAGGVAHEFNNINTSILGFAELAVSECAEGLVKDYIERIRRSALRARNITTNLLTFSGQKSGLVQKANISAVAEESLALARRNIETDGIVVETAFGEVPDTVIDPQQVGQVILNLIINASHALTGRENGRLKITTGQDDGWVFVKVADNGCGIPKENLSKVFSPFFTTKGEHADIDGPMAKVKGTGLGLSISHTIVENHSGEIDVKSEVGVGTEFCVRFPIRRISGKNSETTIGTTRRPPSSNVLVLDDEEDIRDLLHTFLVQEGHTCLATGSGAEALEAICSGEYQLALVDLQMPDMNGVSFIRNIRRMPKEKQPTIMVVTGKTTDENIEGYAEFEVSETIRKPFILKELSDKIRIALLERSEKVL
ncbi:MAG: response regulator [Planctomycetes bacterium]|nr:response regulator [Planctomycetota bacterium]